MPVNEDAAEVLFGSTTTKPAEKAEVSNPEEEKAAKLYDHQPVKKADVFDTARAEAEEPEAEADGEEAEAEESEELTEDGEDTAVVMERAEKLVKDYAEAIEAMSDDQRETAARFVEFAAQHNLDTETVEELAEINEQRSQNYWGEDWANLAETTKQTVDADTIEDGKRGFQMLEADDPELRSVLIKTGLGDHPSIVKMLASVYRAS